MSIMCEMNKNIVQKNHKSNNGIIVTLKGTKQNSVTKRD